MNIKMIPLDIKKDSRGWLAEILRKDQVSTKILGQIIITTILSGQTKGKHYHKRKTEWYAVIRGNTKLILIDNKTHEKKEIKMGEKNMMTVEITPNIYHEIKNIGKKEAFLIAYMTEQFNPQDPDTYTKNG